MTGWKAQMNPPSYGGTPLLNLFVQVLHLLYQIRERETERERERRVKYKSQIRFEFPATTTTTAQQRKNRFFSLFNS